MFPDGVKGIQDVSSPSWDDIAKRRLALKERKEPGIAEWKEKDEAFRHLQKATVARQLGKFVWQEWEVKTIPIAGAKGILDLAVIRVDQKDKAAKFNWPPHLTMTEWVLYEVLMGIFSDTTPTVTPFKFKKLMKPPGRPNETLEEEEARGTAFQADNANEKERQQRQWYVKHLQDRCTAVEEQISRHHGREDTISTTELIERATEHDKKYQEKRKEQDEAERCLTISKNEDLFGDTQVLENQKGLRVLKYG